MLPPFSAFVVYSFVWFLTLLVVLPLRLKSQADTGSVTPGTPRSAPADPQMGRRLIITTVVATIVWAIIAAIILSGAITVDNMDILNRWMHQR